MHVLYIIMLFAIPSLLLAEKCQRSFKNPRTKRVEVIYWIAVIFKETKYVFLRLLGIAAKAIENVQMDTVIHFVTPLVRMGSAFDQTNVNVTKAINIQTMIC